MNQGKTLREVIEQSGRSIQEVSDVSGVSRSTLYNWFETPNLPFSKIEKVIHAIGYNITQDEFTMMSMMEEPKALYALRQKQETLSYKDQYLQLLEKHSELMTELIKLKDELYEIKRNQLLAKQKV